MRHGKSGRKLNRNTSHRKAMYRNMSVSLVKEEIIRTTVPKAKELRRHIEPLITAAKKGDDQAARRHVFNHLRDNEAVHLVFDKYAKRFSERPGGYVRIVKCGYRTGDKAPMAFIEFVGRESKVVYVEPEELPEETVES